MKKICKIHGLSEFALRKDGKPRCKQCNVDAVIKRRKKAKTMAIYYKGGKCQNPECGYDRYVGALEFHHINGTKDFGISYKGHTMSWEKLRKELDKCVLFCSNCHREVHAGLIDISNINPDTHTDIQMQKKKEVFCVDCGTKIDIKAQRCIKCHNIFRRAVTRPSITILKDEINQLGYGGTGRKYGVSGNAVKKWLKYNQ
jgi:hypothetical protein